MKAISNGLQASDVMLLADCETTIRQGLACFAEVGQALATIRDKKLFRGEYKSFEAYCKSQWTLSKSYSTRLITAADVSARVAKVSDVIVPNERVARALAKAPADRQAGIWKKAVKQAAGTLPTEKIVSSLLEKTEENRGETNSVAHGHHFVPESPEAPILTEEYEDGFDDEVTIASLAEPYGKLNKDLLAIGKRIKALADGASGAHLRMVQSRLNTEINSIRGTIKQLTPAEFHAKCKGAGCEQCKETGFLTVMAVASNEGGR